MNTRRSGLPNRSVADGMDEHREKERRYVALMVQTVRRLCMAAEIKPIRTSGEDAM